MIDTIILGTIALDSIETPSGKVTDALGGSAAYAAYACSFFTKPGVISIIGEDFPKNHWQLLEKQMDLTGVEKKGKTFRWSGLYEHNLNTAKTLRTELNCLTELKPKLSQEYRKAKYVFLGNTDPEIQLAVFKQLDDPELVVLDSMNLWIQNKKTELLEMIGKTDVLLLNHDEACQLFETTSLVNAAQKALSLGPTAIVIKKGEHGSLLFTKDKHFSASAYPLELVKDPTGCGDCFGGAFVGYLAKTKDTSEKNMRKAIIYGSVIASFNAEDFSIYEMQKLSQNEIQKRYEEIKEMKTF